MSTKLKIIILLLFLVQGAVFYWSYSDNKKAEEIALLPYKSYLENPLAVTKMNLSGQGLKKLEIDILQFENLEYLDLSDNNFQSVPEEIFDLPSLRTLLLRNNKLYLSQEFSFPINNNIRKLDLSENGLQNRLQKTCFSCLQNLKYLDLSKNDLKIIPNLTNARLDTILLNDNSIKIDDSIKSYLPISPMKYVNFSNNYNNRAAHNTSYLKLNTESINLSNNKLEFPTGLFNLMYNSQLKSIDLSNCHFTNFENLIAENNIEYMNFNGSNVSLSDTMFLKSRNLKYLDLSNIPYSDLDILSGSLEYLSIYLQKENFLILPNLKTLSIDGSIGQDILFYQSMNFELDIFENVDLPKLETVIIRNYSKNGLIELLESTFPEVEIIIENNLDEVEVSEEDLKKFEEEFMKQVEKNNNN